MSSAVADLETQLQAMLALRPPGVSGSKIANITALCTANVQVSPPSPVARIPRLLLTQACPLVRVSPHPEAVHAF